MDDVEELVMQEDRTPTSDQLKDVEEISIGPRPVEGRELPRGVRCEFES